MRKTQVTVSALQDCEKVRLILVQFRSPFSEIPDQEELRVQNIYRSKGIFWTQTKHVEKRVSQFWSVLSKLKSECFADSTHRLVAFPEYALPKECHDGLQAFVDENNCIVVPGSYYETDAAKPHPNNNVCTIFLPKQAPVVIVKQNGFREEADVLDVDRDAPNIVHLLGGNTVLKRFSISISVCRDYLTPYAASTDQGTLCLLDFENPGINLVVMCTSQMSLFEGRAALDVRELPGPRRITAFCNCAGVGIELKSTVGTAILGPQEDPDGSSGDIIESLRGSEEGIVLADVMLNSPELAHIEWKPDKRTFAPVRHAQKLLISEVFDPSGKPSVALSPGKQSGPTERGVWHPAFLEHLQLCIVLHLCRTRQVDLLQSAIDNWKIRNVSAFAIEGKQDALFRYYRPSNTDTDFYQSNYTTLGETEYKRIFMDGSHTIVVKPSNMIKYRTIPVPPKSQNDNWAAEKGKISKLIPKHQTKDRRSLLKPLGQLSRDWNTPNVPPKIREQLSPIFFEQREYVQTLSAYESGRANLREKFILISDGAKDLIQSKVFELEVINKKLLPLPEVRSIYKIDVHIDEAQFDYWVDVVAEPWRIAEIVLGISAWGNRLNLETGTRTMEVLKFYLTESVEGVFATDLPSEVRLFIDEARQLGAVITSPSHSQVVVEAYEFLIACSKAWNEQCSSVQGLDTEASARRLSSFYVNLFYGNVIADKKTQDEYFRKAGNDWSNLYQTLETLFDRILRAHFNSPDEHGAARRRADARLKELGKAEQDSKVILTSSAQAVFRLAKYDSEFKFEPLAGLPHLSRTLEQVIPFRNKMVHEDQAIGALNIHLSRNSTSTSNAVNAIIKVTAQLIDLINACSEVIDGFDMTM